MSAPAPAARPARAGAGVPAAVDTLVIRDGRIAFAGRRAEVNAAPGERELDLAGRAVLPGLVDAHGHLMHLARGRLMLDATGLTSEAAIAERVAQAAARAAGGEWIGGRGWDQNLWAAAVFPTRASLDRAAPRHPVSLVRIDGHAAWVNSAALQAAGIDRHTPDPEGGRILRDARGEPTGVLVDTAQRLVQHAQPLPSEAAFDRAVEEAMAQCLAAGLTGIHEMGVDLFALGAYRRLAERGRYPLRNYVAVAARSAETWAHYRARGPERIGERIAVGALKLLADGALGSRGAALHHPYCDDPDNTGLLLYPPEEIERLAREGLERGFQVCVHAIGDRANTVVLDAYARALASARRPPGADPADHRSRIEHAQILRAEDIARFRPLGVIPSMQATHCTSDMAWAAERLGPDRLAGAYAWRSLLTTGVVVAGGSDFPVESPSPFHGIFASVARRPIPGAADRGGGADPGWQPEQRLTRDEAVRSYTVWNAWAARMEAEVGTLEAGKRADLVVCSEDVFTCPEAHLPHVQAVLTMVGGDIAHADPALGL
jgi:predicted amidohydrolase YtcJ